jgi:2-oxoglutarate ferredoxin oxidoreductase subunit beta
VPSITKPLARHPSLERNSLGLTIRDYEGSMSTLCAGCGHDSVTAAIIRAVWELALEPHMIGKLSGIGCSSKTPTYFVSGAHGFNSAHGRMPAIATGANAGNRELILIGISGDGDSLSIGIGHMVHAIRRNVNVLYVIENNGVYGLTKGQFSASADVGSKSKRGEPNRFSPIDPVALGLSLGATFIARGFSGDKEQLVPILKAGIAHRGLALVDVISPCVTFNDHEGSTKSYLNTRKHMVKVTESDLVLPVESIHAPIAPSGATAVAMHDGTVVNFTKVPNDYDPRDRTKVYAYLQEHVKTGCIPTGLLFIEENAGDVHDLNNTTEIPLSRVPFEALCPGSVELERLQEEFR